MVRVVVRFKLEEQAWSHSFHLDRGATVLQLKEKMLQGRGTPDDLRSFDLRLGDRWVPDAETILQDHTLDFEYLGAEEGGRRAVERTHIELQGQSEANVNRGETWLGETPAARSEVEALVVEPEGAEGLFVPKPAPRPSRPRADPKTPCWKVVGGGNAGGILVRMGALTTSAQLSERLAEGSVVEQIEVVDDRLHYRKVEGAGPQEGWVSLSVNGKQLLVQLEVPVGEAFSLEHGLSLQEDLMWRMAKPEFQLAIKALIAEKGHLTRVQLARRKSELLLSAQVPVLLRYGFEGSTAGVLQMLEAFSGAGLDKHEAVLWNQGQLDILMGAGQL